MSRTKHPIKPDSSHVEPVIIFLASTTPEKLHDYELAAKHSGYPIIFSPIYDLRPYFHSAEETQEDAAKNAMEKIDEISPIVAKFRKNDKRIKKKCEEWGIPYNPDRIFFATEDSVFTLPKDVWTHLRKSLAHYVPEDILARADQHGKSSGPGAETGPIMQAVGGIAHYKHLERQALEHAGYNGHRQVKVNRESVLVLEPLSGESTAPPYVFKSNIESFVHRLDVQPEEPVSSDHYVRRSRTSTGSLMDERETMIRDPKAHPRAHNVHQIGQTLYLPKRKQPTSLRRQPPEDFTVGFLSSTQGNEGIYNRAQLAKTFVQKGYKACFSNKDYLNDADTTEKTFDPINALLSEPEQVLAFSDAIIIGLTSAATEEEKLWNMYTLESLAVAKQLVARDMLKPFFVLNIDGAGDEALKQHMALVGKGMTKDFKPLLNTPQLSDSSVTHKAYSYFEVLSAPTLSAASDAALQLLSERRKNYERRYFKEKTPSEPGGTSAPEEAFKVAVFLSASNDNKQLLEDVHTLGYALAEHDYATIYGGGDRHAMGALWQGNRACKTTHPEKLCHISAFSTAAILEMETQHGRFPQVDYWEETADIYDRMAKMIKPSDAIVVAPGGSGTLQEKMAVLMLKTSKDPAIHDMMHHKSLVIYNMPTDPTQPENPDTRFWNHALHLALGADYDTLSSEEKQLRQTDLGIYVEDTIENVQWRLEHLRTQRNSAFSAPKRRDKSLAYAGASR